MGVCIAVRTQVDEADAVAVDGERVAAQAEVAGLDVPVDQALGVQAPQYAQHALAQLHQHGHIQAAADARVDICLGIIAHQLRDTPVRGEMHQAQASSDNGSAAALGGMVLRAVMLA